MQNFTTYWKTCKKHTSTLRQRCIRKNTEVLLFYDKKKELREKDNFQVILKEIPTKQNSMMKVLISIS